MPNPPFQPLTLSVEEWQKIVKEQDGRLDEDYIPLAQAIRECEAQAQEAASLRQRLEEWQLKFATADAKTLEIVRDRDSWRRVAERLENEKSQAEAIDVQETLREAASRLSSPEGTRGYVFQKALEEIKAISKSVRMDDQQVEMKEMGDIAHKALRQAASISSSAPAATPAPADALVRALRLASEATNGWACYAKRKAEHDDIARLHREIDAISAAERPAPTCATCKHDTDYAECKANWRRPIVGLYWKRDNGCTLHEPASPRSVVAPEKE